MDNNRRESTRPREEQTQRPFVLHTRIVNGNGGGPEKTILNSPRFLRRLGYDAACLYLYPEGDPGIENLRQKANAAGAEMIAIPDGGPVDFKVIRKIRKLCRDRKVDIWHAHDYKTNLLGLLVRRGYPMKLVTTAHGWVGFGAKAEVYHTVGKACLPFYDSVIAVSNDLYTNSRKWRVSKDKLCLIENAIDSDAFKRNSSRADARRKTPFPVSSGIVIAALGRLAHEKGFDLLIDAVADLRDNGRDITLWVGGEGGLQGDLQQQIENRGLAGHAHLLGHVTDPSTMLQAADIFVLSSRREGLPNVVLEAMSLETPVVSTRVAGVPRLIENERQGLLTEIGSVEQLAQAIDRLMLDECLRDKLAKNARRRIVEKFSFANRMQAVSDVYDRLASEH